jgi:hypothetical protein
MMDAVRWLWSWKLAYEWELRMTSFGWFPCFPRFKITFRIIQAWPKW